MARVRIGGYRLRQGPALFPRARKPWTYQQPPPLQKILESRTSRELQNDRAEWPFPPLSTLHVGLVWARFRTPCGSLPTFAHDISPGLTHMGLFYLKPRPPNNKTGLQWQSLSR